jgi:hypothetical protein
LLVIRGRRVSDNCHLLLKDKGERLKDESGNFRHCSDMPIPDKEFVGI